jgi:8-hydroxy-5-deazaflavin:NADPH oxidoreductase
MATKKTIAVIGVTGDMGCAFAKALANSNYRLLLMSRDKNKVGKLSANLKEKNPAADVEVVECEKEACWEADIVLMAVPYEAEREVAEKIREVTTQKVVIDVSNPLNEKHDRLITAPGTSAAEELQKALPNSKVVKAFNTNFSTDFSPAIKESKQIKTFIAGDDQDAVQTVSEMATAIGVKPVVCGSLSASRNIEQMMLQLIELKTEENYNNIIGWGQYVNGPLNFKSIIR